MWGLPFKHKTQLYLNDKQHVHREFTYAVFLFIVGYSNLVGCLIFILVKSVNPSMIDEGNMNSPKM